MNLFELAGLFCAISGAIFGFGLTYVLIVVARYAIETAKKNEKHPRPLKVHDDQGDN